MKKCSVCKEDKPLSNFYVDGRNKKGPRLRSRCKDCCKIYYKSLYEVNKEEKLEKNKQWIINNADFKKLNSRGRHLKKYWPNCTWEEALSKYDELFEKQKGCCAICNKHQSHFKKSLHVDHDHKNGEVRSLLCFHCNRRKVGNHTLESARMVYEYLLKHKKKTG